MTALLPTRVSIYDFLIQDTQPIDSIVADFGHISLPQARLLIEHGIQAIVSALLAYQQLLGGEAVLKKLFQRHQVKELRKHNAFNLHTMATAMQYGQPISDTLFQKNALQHQICQQLAQLAHLSPSQVKPILAALCLLCLRELAILADFAHLDASEVDLWLQQQNQFLQPTCERSCLDNTPIGLHHLPEFDPIWHSVTGYQPPALATLNQQDSMPNYAKAIGRIQPLDRPQSPATITVTTDFDNEAETTLPPTTLLTASASTGLAASTPITASAASAAAIQTIEYAPNIVDTDIVDTDIVNVDVDSNVNVDNPINTQSSLLTFVPMVNIRLPYQRWLLQLAKIADIYLSRNWLKIAPEPKQPPNRPLVSFGFMNEQTKTTASEQPIEYDKAAPFWRSSVFLVLMMIMGSLCLLALGKYYYKQFMQPTYSKALTETPAADHGGQDIAIVRINESDKQDKQTDKSH